MQTAPRIRVVKWLPWVAVVLLLYLASPSLTQQGAKPPAEKTSFPSSYDQVTPTLLGQESFQTMIAEAGGFRNVGKKRS